MRARETINPSSAKIIAESLSRIPRDVGDTIIKEMNLIAPEYLWTRSPNGQIRAALVAHDF